MITGPLYIGKTVTYVPPRLVGYERREVGKVTSWNDSYVFVDYYGTGCGIATRRVDLLDGDQTFYCPDEHNSVLDGAFGRCESQCQNCANLQNVFKIS